ncbi:hypothetical protein D083_1088 [Dickeya solani RNS 08.23.3.1.A]|nr:hypothetical protein D083_1088 [Dickeya solani RNS 08.23.3.1.A]
MSGGVSCFFSVLKVAGFLKRRFMVWDIEVKNQMDDKEYCS